MAGNSSPPYQPNILRKPDKKPQDFRATSQAQSNAGMYDERGGGRLKKVLALVAVLAIVAVVATMIVDAVAGRDLL